MPSNTRGYATALAVAVALVLTSTLTAWGGSTTDVGEYVHDGTLHDLTEDHVTDTTEGFVVDAPDTADEIRINPDYVDSRLDDFDVDHAYTPTDDRLVIQDDDATFTGFAPSAETVFTRGDADTIRFAERPMWLTVDTRREDAIAIRAHDANDDGQPIIVDAAWLESHGVPGEPLAYYHDGTTIPVEPTADGTAFFVDAPHFSHITFQLADLDTSWKQEGHTRELLADGPAGSGTFNITVSDVTDGTIEFRFWSVQNGSTDVFDGDETFEKVDRESLDRAGHYTYNYINETNLADGYAMFGDDQYHLDTVNRNLGTYDFADGNLTYRFDQSTGFLVEVEDDGTGATIAMQSTRTEEVPAATLGPYVAYLTGQVKGMAVQAEYDDFSDSPAHSSFVNPYWNDGDPDETTTGNILATETEVDVKAHYYVLSVIYTYGPDSSGTPCWNRDDDGDGEGECHVQANMEGHDANINFHVHFSPRSGSDDHNYEDSSEKQTFCDAPDCDWDVANDRYEWLKEGTFTLTGTYKHGLLDETSEPFWLCGHARVWDTTDTSETPIFNRVSCRNDLAINAGPSDPNGDVTVTTDPDELT